MRNWIEASCVALVLSAIVSFTRGEITGFSVDILDVSDPGGPAPAGLVVVDFSIEVSADDWFVAGFVTGVTANGAVLRYGATPFLPPGIANPYVTFGSAAYGRNDAARFAPSGTVAEQSIFAPTGYDPATPFPQFESGLVNVAFGPTPPGDRNNPDTPFGRDGSIVRIAVDISSVPIPGADNVVNYHIFEPGHEPAGFLPVFISRASRTSHFGSAAQGLFPPAILPGLNWGVYVPEPSAGLLVLLAVAAFRQHVQAERKGPSVPGNKPKTASSDRTARGVDS
ncbi:MAG: hypothetical protein HZB38_11915 [Planctomycetes bacterium]|nr:hypothetical protein [Planctomycetota bacterium]